MLVRPRVCRHMYVCVYIYIYIVCYVVLYNVMVCCIILYYITSQIMNIMNIHNNTDRKQTEHTQRPSKQHINTK